ncbi:hypothetical protein K431DRAFT_162337 [Polychaeton citri CBS 116435]|uniref:Uncharacterized protein n=1 Tax=Polychaeton citri CBS 116435 TaxID=1314669 RepID=A0A9P4Q090_9PEZI|nr:hypothetical protein K431DRAFT_162337 [Polychaeton citri CBS 116435]
MEDRLGSEHFGSSAPLRPESTIASEFAAEMSSLLSSTIDPLEQKVEEKKLGVGNAQQELLELEARLRATEQRLAKVSRQPSPARVAPQAPSYPQQPQAQQASIAPVRAPPPVPGGYGGGGAGNEYAPADAAPYQPQPPPSYTAPRPPAGPRETTQQMMSHMPGALPLELPRSGSRTPGGDYVMVQNEGA